MMIASTRVVATADNLDEVRDACAALDQRAELKPGCETWGTVYAGGQRGQVTVWPEEGRAAVCWGADSQWGDWDDAARTLRLDSGEIVDEDGEAASEKAAA
jgi:hypothetical protein